MRVILISDIFIFNENTKTFSAPLTDVEMLSSNWDSKKIVKGFYIESSKTRPIKYFNLKSECKDLLIYESDCKLRVVIDKKL